MMIPLIKDKEGKDIIEDYRPLLIGNPPQFIIQQGEHYCLRETCEGCQYAEGDQCSYTEGEIQTDIIPSARKGIGLELESFLILRKKEGMELPSDLFEENEFKYFNNNLFPENLQFLIRDWDYTKNDCKLRTLKGQIRYYGGKEEFNASPYVNYFEVFNEYSPIHKTMSLDFSAIEPKITTILSKEPNWISIFEGKPKAIIYEVESDEPLNLDCIVSLNNKQYCCLKGELDKETFEEQCVKCVYDNKECRKKAPIRKNVSGDWHSLNAEGLFGDEFIKCVDKFLRKALRGISKTVGLALCYGGTAYTVSGNMGCSKEKAQEKIDNFFRLLVTLKQYMDRKTREVLETGLSFNLFGRMRDLSKFAFAEKWKDKSFAVRSALNGPIQSTAADILKIATIRSDEWLRKNVSSPIIGVTLPQVIDFTIKSYRDIKAAMFMSVHDETVLQVREDCVEDVIPKLYNEMQLNDLMSSMGFKFSFDLECEYDESRSWTASKAYYASKIYLLNNISSQSRFEPNTILLEFDSLNNDILNKINDFDSIDGGLRLAVNSNNSIYFHDKNFSVDFVESLGIEYHKVFIEKK